MSTPDRTTLKTAIDALADGLRAGLIADPPTAASPFRRVAVGRVGVQEHPRPFLALMLKETRPIGAADNDKLIRVTMTLRLVTDILASDPHGALLDAIGAVDDYLDSIIDTGVVEGADGFDDRVWAFDYPATTAGARVAAAEASQSFVVRVQREANRVPAP
jgi:hypothetical protein